MLAVQGKFERKNITIIMLDSSGTTETMRWNLNDAWPSEWRGAPLDAMSKEIAIESLTLVFDTLERA
jgi:phage tail-like protein